MAKRVTLGFDHPVLGPVEGMYGGLEPASRRAVGAQEREEVFVAYDLVDRSVLAGTLNRHPDPSSPYTVRQADRYTGPANWGVWSAEGHLCAVHMNGSHDYLGTEKQAKEWARRINERWELCRTEEEQ